MTFAGASISPHHASASLEDSKPSQSTPVHPEGRPLLCLMVDIWVEASVFTSLALLEPVLGLAVCFSVLQERAIFTMVL